MGNTEAIVFHMQSSKRSKPSIVFVHGIWADGSSFSKVIPTLQAEGHEVIAAQYGLDTLAGDVTAVGSALGRVSSPVILVGHSRARCGGGSLPLARSCLRSGGRTAIRLP
jgi:pimeloyl-ACP methyl ester carboxylesterase